MNYFINRKIETSLQFDSFERILENREINQAYFIVDSKVLSIYKKKLEPFLADFPHLIINSEEGKKTFSSVEIILDYLQKNKVDRTSHLIVFGGGMLCDLCGFVASIYKRGVSYTLIPTTLLAMIDAAHGGKTSLNYANTKNLLGTFYFPQNVIVDLNFLQSLSDDEIQSGAVELIKNLLLVKNPDFLKYLSKNFYNTQDLISENFVKSSIEAKWKIVSKDPFESNERKYLNFGHTLAHALESQSKFSISHGEAVAYGILFSLSKFSPNFENKKNLIKLFESYCHHNDEIRNFSAIDLGAFFYSDKKIVNNKISFVFLNDIGDPQILPMPLEKLIEDFSSWKEQLQ